MSTATQTTAADIALIVLGKTYGRFGYSATSLNHSDIVSVLENRNYRASADENPEGTASIAAETVRKCLWTEYTGRAVAAAATCALFYALGRSDELGWIATSAADRVPYDGRQYGQLLRDLSEDDHGTVVGYSD